MTRSLGFGAQPIGTAGQSAYRTALSGPICAAVQHSCGRFRFRGDPRLPHE